MKLENPAKTFNRGCSIKARDVRSDRRQISKLFISKEQALLFLLLPALVMVSFSKASGQSMAFASPIKFGSGGAASTSVAVGDFNNDGKADLALANQDSYSVGILLGSGDGSFLSAISFPAGYSPRAIASVDINADGKLDLIVANEAGNDLSVLIGNGDGTFQPAANFGPIDRPEHIAIADLNLDGKQDLAVAGFGGRVFILTGNGDGTFLPPRSYATGLASTSVAVGDFNKDGKQDLAVANQDSSDLSILVNAGDGSFTAAVNYATGPNPTAINVGDFNQDGNLDLATAEIGQYSNGYIAGSGFVTVFKGNGDATFQQAASYDVGTVPHSVAVGDLNSDGLLELIVANAYSNTVSILQGNSNGTFSAAKNVSTGDPSNKGKQNLSAHG